MIVTVTEEPGPVLRVWVGAELAAEVRLEPARALALAEALVAAARRARDRSREHRVLAELPVMLVGDAPDLASDRL